LKQLNKYDTHRQHKQEQNDFHLAKQLFGSSAVSGVKTSYKNLIKPINAKKKLPSATLPIWKLLYLLVESAYGVSLWKYQLVAVPAMMKSPV
jgi:hypothetical protein